MNKEAKQRVIGKIVAINSDRFTVELLGGIENFNINGFDDIHYFAQLNSYVTIPYQDYFIVAEVVAVREREANVPFTNPTEQFLSKSKSGKYLDVLPIGKLKLKSDNKSAYKFEFGVSVYPPLYADTLYIKETELDAIFNVDDTEYVLQPKSEKKEKIARYKTLSIGKSTIFPDYDLKIDIDKFFGAHSAVLGNTGSGKSCTIASMLQGLYKLKSYSATGSTFIFFDVNGEYQKAFETLGNNNTDIAVDVFTLDNTKGTKPFILPHWFLTIDEWALLLQASEKTQLPILRNALGLACLFTNKNKKEIKKTKNHILATCITQILRDETSSPSKSDRIISLLRKFNTEDIHLTTSFKYEDEDGTQTKIYFDNGKREVDATIENSLFVHFGQLIGTLPLQLYLEKKDDKGNSIFFADKFEMPLYDKNTNFDFNTISEAIDLAILYEEAHGNRQIRDYCSSLITRVKSIQDRSDFEFLKQNTANLTLYKREILGLVTDSKKIKKKNQLMIIDLSSVEDEIVEVISCVLSRIVYDTLKAMEPRNHYPVNLVLEEAHRYISDDPRRSFLKANTIFESIAKEGRKFGLLLLISSQRPSELSRTVLSQCNNFIVHRIQNPEDLSHIRQITPHISEAVLKRMPSIPTQHALIFGNAVNLPTTFKVNEASPTPKSENNAISINW